MKINKLKNKSVKLNIAKIPGINTRQTLSLIKNLPTSNGTFYQKITEILKRFFQKLINRDLGPSPSPLVMCIKFLIFILLFKDLMMQKQNLFTPLKNLFFLKAFCK